MSEIAYELRANYKDSYAGGLITVGEDRELNVAEALEEGGGYIVADESDHMLVTVLDDYPPLKRTTLSAAQEASQEAPKEEKASAKAGSDKSAGSSGGKDRK